MDTEYHDEQPTREDVDVMSGPVLLEFGANWCPHCQALEKDLRDALARYPDVRHIKVADGKGKPLGRSFRVKLWPNLVFLRDGQMVRQFARPNSAEIAEGLAAIATPA